MKIGFLTPEYPHSKTGNSGGIGTSISNLSKGLLRLGCNVTVLVYGQSDDEVFDDNGVKIIRIKNVKFKGISRYLTQKKIERIINSLVNKNEIQLVEAPDWTGITSYIQPNCPVVIKLHGSDTYFCHFDNRPVKFWNKFHEKKALKKAQAHIAVSKYVAVKTNELFNTEIKFEIIHNGIDLSNIFSDTLNEIDNSILYFGTLIRKKGALELPLIFNEVIKKNPDAKLIIVGKDASDVTTGSSSTWSLMKELFNKESLKKVKYLGVKSHKDVFETIQTATVCVFPTFAEAFPVTWLEAMAFQKPIVASDIGWASEIIDDKQDGLLVNPKKHYDFAEKIVDCLHSRNLRDKIGYAARKKIEENFRIEYIAKQNIDFYKKVINDKV